MPKAPSPVKSQETNKSKNSIILFFGSLIILSIAFVFIITVHNTDYSANDINKMSREVTTQIVDNIPPNSKIAILNIQDITYDLPVKYKHSNLIVENLITNLVRNAANNYQVFERNQIDQAEKELKLQDSDMFDKNTAQQFGKFVGADYVIYGNLINLSETAIFNFRCMKVVTFEIVGVANVQLSVSIFAKLFNNSFVLFGLIGVGSLMLLFSIFKIFNSKRKVYSPDGNKYIIKLYNFLVFSTAVKIANTDNSNAVIYKVVSEGIAGYGIRKIETVHWKSNTQILVVFNKERGGYFAGNYLFNKRMICSLNNSNFLSKS